MSQQLRSEPFLHLYCLNCEHDHFEVENQRDNTRFYPCSNIRCYCRHFISSENKAEAHRKYIAAIQRTKAKIRYLLENIPPFRELTNKQFIFAYWHYNNNFTTGVTLDARTYLKLTDPETIRRARQKLVEENPAFGPTDAKTIDEKIAKEWGILQWCRDDRETGDFV